MSNQFEVIMELVNPHVKMRAQGSEIRLLFEIPYNMDREVELIPFRGKTGKAIISQNIREKNQPVVTIEDEMNVVDIKFKALKNGDRLQLVLEQSYAKDKEILAVSLRGDQCKIFFTENQNELIPSQGKDDTDFPGDLGI